MIRGRGHRDGGGGRCGCGSRSRRGRGSGRNDGGLGRRRRNYGRSRGRDSTITEDVVLSAVRESVQVIVERGSVSAFEHVIALELVPVHGGLGANGAVARGGGHTPVVGVRTASTRDLGRSDGLGAGSAFEVALEGSLVDLLRPRISLVDPVPCAQAFSVGAGGHGSRDFEIGETRPDTLVLYREDREIIRLDVGSVRSVCDRKGAAAEVVYAIGVILRQWSAGARGVAIRSLESSGTGAGSPVRRSALIAGELDSLGLPDRKLEDILRMRGKVF